MLPPSQEMSSDKQGSTAIYLNDHSFAQRRCPFTRRSPDFIDTFGAPLLN